MFRKLYRRIFPFSARGAGVPGIGGGHPRITVTQVQEPLFQRMQRARTAERTEKSDPFVPATLRSPWLAPPPRDPDAPKPARSTR